MTIESMSDPNVLAGEWILYLHGNGGQRMGWGQFRSEMQNRGFTALEAARAIDLLHMSGRINVTDQGFWLYTKHRNRLRDERKET